VCPLYDSTTTVFLANSLHLSHSLSGLISTRFVSIVLSGLPLLGDLIAIALTLAPCVSVFTFSKRSAHYNREKAELLNNYFSSVFTVDDGSCPVLPSRIPVGESLTSVSLGLMA